MEELKDLPVEVEEKVLAFWKLAVRDTPRQVERTFDVVVALYDMHYIEIAGVFPSWM